MVIIRYNQRIPEMPGPAEDKRALMKIGTGLLNCTPRSWPKVLGLSAELMDGYVGGWVGELMVGWMDGRMDKWRDGQIVGWMGGWMHS